MRAMAIPSYGPVEQMKLVELPTPEPGAGQVRVKVHASAVNPSELKVATGSAKILHGRDFPMVLGCDFSGVVDLVGTGVAKKLGAEVVAVCATHAVDFVRALGADVVIDRKEADPSRGPDRLLVRPDSRGHRRPPEGRNLPEIIVRAAGAQPFGVRALRSWR